MPNFGLADLNPSYQTVEWASIEEPWPLIPRTKMRRNGTLDNFSTVVFRAFTYFQQYILKKAPKTWVPIVAGYPQIKIYPASQPTLTQIGLKREIGTIKRVDDYYFLNPFVDLVTYTLKYQAPAGYKKAFGSEKMRRPTMVETFPVSGAPGLLYEVQTEMMDNLIQFDCWSSTGRGADKLADLFKEFMRFMTGSIMAQGFGHIKFWERGVDKDLTGWRDDISVRTLQYYVGTQEMSIIPRGTINNISFDLGITEGANTDQDYFVRHVIGDQPFPPSGYYDPSGLALYPDGLVNTNQGTSSLIEVNS